MNISLHLLYNKLENINLTFNDCICASLKINYRYVMSGVDDVIDTIDYFKLKLNYSEGDLNWFKEKLNNLYSYDGGGDFRIFGNVWFTEDRCLEKTNPKFYELWELKQNIIIPNYLK